ncbi:MAG: M20/M25/M40 family metallo-hydrolase [Candidatus Hodarchaeota archaeon]
MENSMKETIALLSELIQNKCVNPPGNEMKSIQSIQRFMQEHNVECQEFESSPNRGNLVARIPGTKNGSKLMFGPAHVDVVPVENPEEWQVDPFSGTVKDGYVWGRGALDMLYIVVTQVQAFIQLQKEKFQPKGDLILLIVSDEEAGGTYGAEWMLKNHPEEVKTDYLVTEAGGLSIAPGKFAFMIGEKGGAWKRISFKGTPGHGSMPFDSDNAAHKAAQAAIKIREYCDSQIPLTTEYLHYLADGLSLGFIQRFMLTNKRLLPFTLNNLKKKDQQMARVFHGLTRMTLSPNIIQGGTKVNVIPAAAHIDVDIRTLPGQDDEYVVTHLEKALGDLAKEARIESMSVEEGGFISYGNASPASSEFVQAMEKAVQQEIPDSTLVPFIMPAVSDCRFFRERGVEAYGFSLFDPETPMSHLASLAHGTDERISLKTIELSYKVYYNLAKTFL